MVLKYHVSINMKFCRSFTDSGGIPKDDKKKRNERKNAFLQQLNDFLSGEENTGKSFVSHFRYDRDAMDTEESDIIIRPLE